MLPFKGENPKNVNTTETERRFTCFIIENTESFRKFGRQVYLSYAAQGGYCKWNVINPCQHPLIRNPNSDDVETAKDIVLDDSQEDDIETWHESNTNFLIETIKANNQVIKSQIENNNAKIQSWLDERCSIA